jgi:outer membrane protein TolC
MKVLEAMVRSAIDRSHAVQRSQLLTQAAQADLNEAKAAGLPRADLTLGYGRGATESGTTSGSADEYSRASITVSAPIYDGGRTRALTDYREHLSKVSEFDMQAAHEEISRAVVLLALDRSRFYKQGQVYTQHVNRLACMTRMLERITKVDKGRQSEQVQARKTLGDARLALQRSRSEKRQVETSLRRLVGQQLPNLEGLTTILLGTPSLEKLKQAALDSTDLNRLSAQASAAGSLAGSVATQRRPTVNWELAHQRNSIGVESRQWRAGINVAIPIFNFGAGHAARAASYRAQAARLSLNDATEERLSRLTRIHDHAIELAAQAKAVDKILQNSDRLRQYTLKQWRKLGRRSLFDVMSTERDHYGLRVNHVNTLHDRQQANAQLESISKGLIAWLDLTPSPVSDQ